MTYSISYTTRVPRLGTPKDMIAKFNTRWEAEAFLRDNRHTMNAFCFMRSWTVNDEWYHELLESHNGDVRQR